MITAALIFLAISIGSAVLGAYANSDQGLDHIMYWFAIVALIIAAGFVLTYLSMRSVRD